MTNGTTPIARVRDDPTTRRLRELAAQEAAATKDRLATRTEAACLFSDAVARVAETKAAWERVQAQARRAQAKAVEDLLGSGMPPDDLTELLGISATDLRRLRATARVAGRTARWHSNRKARPLAEGGQLPSGAFSPPWSNGYGPARLTRAAAALDFLAAHPNVAAGQLGSAGHCTGGHIAFRAALAPEVKATACWYATGLHDGKLGKDPDAGTLARAKEASGELLMVFGTEDPHTPDHGRRTIKAALEASGARFEWRLYEAAHAFGRDEGGRYDPAATDAAFAETLALYRRAFAD